MVAEEGRMPAELTVAVRDQSDENGQGLVEYSLILMLIAIVVILVIAVLGHQTGNLFSNVSSGLGT